jgi:cytochrome c
MCGVATDPATTDGPVANFRVHVLAALALAGSVSAASTQDAALGEKVFAKCRSAWSN